MSNVPQQQKALFLESKQGSFAVQTTSVPKPGSGQLLIKIKATALNPVDWKIQKYGAYVSDYPAILGTDISGEVEALGEGVTKFQVGDRVVFQGILAKEKAGFQQYTLADEYHLAKVPSNITFDQAASIPLGMSTAYLAMYNTSPHGIGLKNPVDPAGQGHSKGEPFVVLGGATSVGQYAIQFAKLSGFSPIITTASVKHADYLKPLGATHVLDRNLSPSAFKSEVDKITKEPIKYVYDAVSLEATQKQGDAVLASGGHLILVLPPSISASDKHFTNVLALRQLEHNIKPLSALYDKLTGWLESGVIQPNKVELLTGGLNGIVGGLKRMENNQISGVKLVARPDETD